jgi:NAD(P)-dependent dehydrogenase (short-subunit alcohol dehydrogenase family)
VKTSGRADVEAPLRGRVALVTGASRGIGLAISRALAEAGAELIMVARNRQVLARAAEVIPGAPFTVAADVAQPADVKRLLASAGKRFNRLDILVSNAGVFTYKPFSRTSLTDWQRNIGVNLTAIFLVTQAALPLLTRQKKRGGTSLINILSVSSRQAFPQCSAYTAAKFGALGLTRVLAEELRPLGIRVSAILPGSTSTRMVNEFDFPVDRKKLVQPEDVAQAVLCAVFQPEHALVDEMVITPACGSL